MKVGVRILYYIQLTHLAGGISSISTRAFGYNARSRLRYVKKHFSWATFIFQGLSALVIVLHCLILPGSAGITPKILSCIPSIECLLHKYERRGASSQYRTLYY